MRSSKEQTLDVVSLEERKRRIREAMGATVSPGMTTANVGSFAVPIGGKVVRDKKGFGDVKPIYPRKKLPLLRRVKG